MAEMTSLGLLGCGHMGGALVRGAMSAKLLKPEHISIFDPDPAATRPLEALGCRAAASPLEVLQNSQVIVLAIKPQIFSKLAPEWKAAFSALPEKMVISVMAGIRSMRIREVFPVNCKVIRVMPNLGLSVGEGGTAIAVDGLAESSLQTVEALFRASGITARVSEDQLDAVTGISGSGPMYVFEFVEAMTEAGVRCGLARETAYALVKQTLRGSLALLENSKETPSDWTKKVCSPGGTTERALGVLNAQGFKELLAQAVRKATERSKELSS